MKKLTAPCHAMFLLGCLALPASCAEPTPQQPPGLSVQQGQLVLHGKPYRGIGANYYSLFYRTLQNSSDRSYEKQLSRLSKAGIPFVRFMACGFWPVDWDLYLQDKDAYFGRLDRVVRCAEKNHIGLIPSLFWHMATVPDIVGEPMDQLGHADSKSLAFIRNYTREIVTRYRQSPAVWGWEFGNEYNLHVDLPHASQHLPPIWPALKTARKRTPRDALSSEAMLTAFGEFARTVRQYDKHRILITGNSIPRPSAYHNSLERTWQRDSREQFRKILLRDNPDPFDVLCVHVYPRANNDYSAHAKNLPDLIKTLQEISTETEKPLFIGEFGAPSTPDTDADRTRFLELVHAIEAHKVPLSAFWVFDLAAQGKSWNVTFDNERHYMLELVSEANRRLQSGE